MCYTVLIFLRHKHRSIHALHIFKSGCENQIASDVQGRKKAPVGQRRFVGPAEGGADGGPHALGGPRWSSGAALRRPGGGATWWRPHGGHPSAHSPRAPCSSSADALAPDLSPPTGFGGVGILALFARTCSSSTGASGPPALGGSTVSVHSVAIRSFPHNE
jgi:hypothetical protein